MNTYRTAEIAAMIGIHPNTVRLYESWELIPKPQRLPNGYRIFTDFHVAQFQLARLAFQSEILQNGLRKKMVEMVKTAATGDFDRALQLTQEYLEQLRQERANAEEATKIAGQILSGEPTENKCVWKRKEVSVYLNISMDTLRNWERRHNGYRVYTEREIRRLKVIRSLRCANYSMEAILRMLLQFSENPNTDIKRALDTPQVDTDVVTVCDRLITSLTEAENNAKKLLDKLNDMKIKFS